MPARHPLTKNCSRYRYRIAAATVGVLAISGIGLAADLSPSDIQQLSRFERTVGMRDQPAASRADLRAQADAGYRLARELFSGRGPDIARHFLTHTDYPPANDAFYFLLEALADTETALVLIRSLWAPPKVVSGPELRSGERRWLRERDKAEIRVAIEAALVNDAVNADARVVDALLDAATRLRPTVAGQGAGDAATAVELLGRCRGPHATAALHKLAQDSDAGIRSLAVQGLGRSVDAATAHPPDQTATLTTLGQVLQSDPDARARAEAATALGRSGSGEGVAPLHAALARERHPQVVDAILLALKQLGSPLDDPAVCGEVVGRTWDASAARLAFDCWRTRVSPEGLLDAALYGPAQRRALALHALIETSVAPRRESFLAIPPGLAAPAPPAPPGARTVTNAPPPVARAAVPPPAAFDEATRDRLLNSAVEILSIPSYAFPRATPTISDTTTLLVRDALWELAGRDMGVALSYADRISTPGARTVVTGRFGASSALYAKDARAYREYRRPRQAAWAAWAALASAVLLVWSRTRRAGAILVTAALGWGVASLFMTTVRELPPPPLALLTLPAVAFLSAGVSVAWIAWRTQGTAPAGLAKTAGRTGGAATLAAVLAFFGCGVTRWNDIFPVGGEGWELIFDPIGCAILAAVIAVALYFWDRLLLRRLVTSPAPPT